MKKKNHGRDRIEMVCLVPIANDEEPLKEDEALHELLFTSKHKKRRKKRKKKNVWNYGMKEKIARREMNE